MTPVRVSAKTDYALRAMAELAAAPPGPVKGERLASSQEIPLKFLENILTELRRAELVATPARRRGRVPPRAPGRRDQRSPR